MSSAWLADMKSKLKKLAHVASIKRPAASLEAISSAARPATRLEQVEQLEQATKRLKTSRAPRDSTKVRVTFIMCEDVTSAFFLRPIPDALEAGADMINIIFPFDPRDYHGGQTYNPAWAPIFELKR